MTFRSFIIISWIGKSILPNWFELNEGIEWWTWLGCFNLGREFVRELKRETETELWLICWNNSLKFMLTLMHDLLSRMNSMWFGYLLWIPGDWNYLTLLSYVAKMLQVEENCDKWGFGVKFQFQFDYMELMRCKWILWVRERNLWDIKMDWLAV